MVTRGWNGYRNKSQHRKSTLEKKILPPFQQGFEPATFQSRVRRSNHWAIPAPAVLFQIILVFICACISAASSYKKNVPFFMWPHLIWVVSVVTNLLPPHLIWVVSVVNKFITTSSNLSCQCGYKFITIRVQTNKQICQVKFLETNGTTNYGSSWWKDVGNCEPCKASKQECTSTDLEAEARQGRRGAGGRRGMGCNVIKTGGSA